MQVDESASFRYDTNTIAFSKEFYSFLLALFSFSEIRCALLSSLLCHKKTRVQESRDFFLKCFYFAWNCCCLCSSAIIFLWTSALYLSTSNTFELRSPNWSKSKLSNTFAAITLKKFKKRIIELAFSYFFNLQKSSGCKRIPTTSENDEFDLWDHNRGLEPVP